MSSQILGKHTRFACCCILLPGFFLSMDNVRTTANGEEHLLSANTPATGIRGSVRNPRGDAVPGLELRGGASKTTTDAAGMYFLPEPPGPVLLELSDGGRQDYVLEEAVVAVVDGNVITRDLSCAWVSANVSGVVRDSSAPGVGDLGINAEADILGLRFRQHTRTGADGSYSFGLSWGAWAIRPDDSELQSRSYASVAPVSEEITDQPLVVNFTVFRPDARIEGRVITPENNPVSNIPLELFEKQSGYFNRTTDSSGRFSLPVRSGSYQVHLDSSVATAQGLIGPDLRITLQTNETQQDIVLVARPGTHWIRGHVTNVGGGVLGVSLSARAVVAGSLYVVNSGTSWPDFTGAYEMAVFDGKWTLGIDCLSLDYPCPEPLTLEVSAMDRTADFALRYGDFDSFFAINPMEDGNVRLKFLGPADGSVEIYYSTDLKNWSLLLTGGFSAGSAWFDVAAPGRSGFFKALVCESLCQSQNFPDQTHMK